MLHTREPGGTQLSDELREIMLLRKELRPTARAEALLVCTARAQLVEEVLRPALQMGRVVVCDRYAGSTLAYQGYGRGVDLGELRDVLAFATEGLWPDLTFLLDIPPDEGLRRKLGQGGGDPAVWDRIESEAMDFHERVRAGYLALAAADPDHWRVLDGREPVEQLAEAVWESVTQMREI